MNIRKMIEDQKELDKAIFKKSGLKGYPINKIKLAYHVELGEALNEWSGFKYWKKTRKENREALLEELADCLHFALSLEGHYKYFEKSYNQYQGSELWGLEDESIITIANWCFEDDEYLGNIIALTLALGFTREQLVDAYYKKRDKNFERISNGY